MVSTYMLVKVQLIRNSFVERAFLNTSQQISGRTLLCLANDVLCNCKKMMALVTDTASPYKNDTFPSERLGTTMHGGACLLFNIANVASQRIMCILEKKIKMNDKLTR
jgi:hypothetical protein